ncbi:MAG: spore coat protein CotJB [Eubacteriales bacterium]|nr:spore coat protein CotJB [Eubacteriales bacterium]
MKSGQAKLLRKLMDVDFVIHETVLYLDGHPGNQRALEFYKKAAAEQKEIYNQYVTQYGPIVAEDVRQNSWTWIDFPWPWQNDKEVDN